MRKKTIGLPLLPVRSAPASAAVAQPTKQSSEQTPNKKRVALTPSDANRTPNRLATVNTDKVKSVVSSSSTLHQPEITATLHRDCCLADSSSASATTNTSSSSCTTASTTTTTSDTSTISDSSFTVANEQQKPVYLPAATASLACAGTTVVTPASRAVGSKKAADEIEDEGLDLIEFLLTPTPQKLPVGASPSSSPSAVVAGANSSTSTASHYRNNNDKPPSSSTTQCATMHSVGTNTSSITAGGGACASAGDLADHKHYDAVVRRLEQEQARIAGDVNFFRDAANSMRKMAVFGKQQLLLQLEHFSEVELRKHIVEAEADYFHDVLLRQWRDSLSHTLDASRQQTQLAETQEALSGVVYENDDLRRELSVQQDAHRQLNQQLVATRAEREALAKDHQETRDDLAECRASIRAMCQSWQKKFDELGKQHASLQQKLTTASQDLVRFRNDEQQQTRLNKQKRPTDASTCTACDDNCIRAHVEEMRIALSVRLSELSEWEAYCRRRITGESLVILVREDDDDAASAEAEGPNSTAPLSLASQILHSSAEALRHVSEQRDVAVARRQCGENEVAKYKRRTEQVNAECDRLVASNSKMQQELVSLRKELYNA